jgi:hypothetical protein
VGGLKAEENYKTVISGNEKAIFCYNKSYDFQAVLSGNLMDEIMNLGRCNQTAFLCDLFLAMFSFLPGWNRQIEGLTLV